MAGKRRTAGLSGVHVPWHARHPTAGVPSTREAITASGVRFMHRIGPATATAPFIGGEPWRTGRPMSPRSPITSKSNDSTVAGVSGGGPHALASARRLNHRVSGVGIVSGIGPVAEREFGSSMEGLNKGTTMVAARAPLFLHAFFSLQEFWMQRWPEAALRAVSKTMPEADVKMLERPEVQAASQVRLAAALGAGGGPGLWRSSPETGASSARGDRGDPLTYGTATPTRTCPSPTAGPWPSGYPRRGSTSVLAKAISWSVAHPREDPAGPSRIRTVTRCSRAIQGDEFQPGQRRSALGLAGENHVQELIEHAGSGAPDHFARDLEEPHRERVVARPGMARSGRRQRSSWKMSTSASSASETSKTRSTSVGLATRCGRRPAWPARAG